MDPTTKSPATVALGYVSRPNGLLGAVVVHSDPSMADLFTRGLALELHPRTGSVLHTVVRSAAPIRGGVRLTLDKVSNRNQSEALVGATVHVKRDCLGPMAEGEYLDTDLVGLEVVTEDGTSLGGLIEVIATGANDVYIARTPDGAETLIPAVAHAVVGVDLEAGRITVRANALEYTPAPVIDETPRPARPAKKPKPPKP